MALFLQKINRKTFRFLAPVFFCALLCFSGCESGTPKEVVDNAVKTTFRIEHPLTEEIGLKEIFSSLASGAAHSTELDLTLQKLEMDSSVIDPGKIEGIGISLDSTLSPKEKHWTADLGIDYGNAIAVHSVLDLNQTAFTVNIPKLLDNSFSVDLATLGADLNGKSLAAGFLSDYIYLPGRFSLDPWSLGSLSFLKGSAASTGKESDLPKEKIKALYDSLSKEFIYTKLKYGNRHIPKDTPAKRFYSVTVPSSACRDFLLGLVDLGYAEMLPGISSRFNEICKTFGIDSYFPMDDLPDQAELKEMIKMLPDICDDPVFIVGLTRKGIISYVNLELSILDHPYQLELKAKNSNGYLDRMLLTISDEKHSLATLDLSFGSDFQAFDCDLQLKVSLNKETYTFLLQYELERAVKEFAFSTSLSHGADVLFSLAAEGLVKNIQKNDHFTTVFHYLDVDYANFSASVSGTVALSATPKVIVFPSGKIYRVFKLNQLDLLVLGAKLTANVQKDPVLSQLLDLILGN